MEKEILEQIDQTIVVMCKEMRMINTEKMIALAESLGIILIARAHLNVD